MLDIGWTELLVIAVVLIVVVGPKDLPPMLRAFGKMTANLRKMAGDFRTQFDQALREADMDDVRQTISDAQRFHPANAIREAINPLREMGNEIRNDLQKATTMPPLTGSDSKADDGETSAASLEDLLPMPELSLPESPPPSVAATPAVSQTSAPTQGQTPPVSTPSMSSAAPVAAAAAGQATASPAAAVSATPLSPVGTGHAAPESGSAPAAQKKPRAPRKPKLVAEPADGKAVLVAPLTTSAPKKTRAAAKTIVTAEVPAVVKKPATRARKTPATPKDDA